DDTGDATWEIPLQTDDRQLDLEARYDGDTATASTSRSVAVDLDAPFVTPELQVPPTVEIGSGNVPVVVSVHVAEVVQYSPANRSVEVIDLGHPAEPVAEGMTDETGRAEFHVPAASFRGPGVHTLI